MDKLLFGDDFKKVIFADESERLIFEDDFKKLIFDVSIDITCTGIGSCIIGSTFTVG